MKISYNWLKDYTNTVVSVEETARILTDIGIEVEGIETTGGVTGGLEGLFVGEVLTCEKHPDADKLHITTVDYGDGIKTIVCGATNVKAGEKVIVAAVGTTLYPTSGEESFKIKKSKIRGIESMGMLCAEDEIGVGTSHEGIILLDKSIPVGTPAREVFTTNEDHTLEIGLTPNRIDAASHIGVARDLTAYLKFHGNGAELIYPEIGGFAVDNHDLPIGVEVLNTQKAPHYMGITVSGVKIAPSAEWLQKRLKAIGINPKNNVVDITNFILHELGQPLHAFDAAKIKGGKVIVRNAVEGEKFLTLDGIDRTLSAEDLMICNAVEPMCIAGVMGGVESGISDTTTDIFIESAYFNPVTVRKSAKRHGINSDASFRYERGTDPNILPYALKRAALLVKELAGGTISSEIVDVCSESFPPFVVELSADKTERIIGKKIGRDNILKIVRALDVQVLEENGDLLTLGVPQYRVDVKRDVDVIEEIMRIYGFNNIELPQGIRSAVSHATYPDRERMIDKVSDFLSANGFNEIMSNSLTKLSYYDQCQDFPAENCVKIANPLSADLNGMRQTLLFNALEAVELNTNRKKSDLKLYEFGNCYFYNAAQKENGGLAPYSERYKLAILMTGLESAASWRTKAVESGFFSVKSVVERIFRQFGLNVDNAAFAPVESDIFKEGIAVSLKGKELVRIGEIARSQTKPFDIKNSVFFAEFDFDNFIDAAARYKFELAELSKYPEVRRDLALLVDKEVTFAQLHAVAFKTEKTLLKNVTLFDVYEGDKLPAGKKSYALNFVLEDTTKTLTDTVIDKCMNNLIFQFEKQLGAKIRG